MATILALDDDPVNLDLLRSTFEPFGYKVNAATTVAEALALASDNPPDLILSDLYMPGECGYDLLLAVKADARTKDVPFIIITSRHWGDVDRPSALALGADRFLERPIEPQDLLAEIAACLRERKRA